VFPYFAPPHSFLASLLHSHPRTLLSVLGHPKGSKYKAGVLVISPILISEPLLDGVVAICNPREQDGILFSSHINRALGCWPDALHSFPWEVPVSEPRGGCCTL
jgi:hypothetical protein